MAVSIEGVMRSEDELSKMLHEFTTPITPLHTAPLRHVTFTGKVSDQLSDMSVHRYKDSDNETVTHPRDLAKSWQVGSRKMFSHTSDLKYWLDSNVVSFMNTRQYWQNEVTPQRLLYAYGARGNGRLTFITDYCCRHRINLLFVRHSSHPKDMFFSVYEQAKKMEPCIVYVNNATRVFSDGSYTNEFLAAHSSTLTSSAMNVWTVLSGSYPPKKLLVHSKHGAHPIYSLLEHSGDVVHVPCISDIDEAGRVAVDFLRELTNDKDYIANDGRTPLVSHLARAFLFHTMAEIRLFLRNIIARHNVQCALSKSDIKLPPLSVFDAALQALPTAESGGQCYRKLFTRDVYADYTDQLTAWRAFTNLLAPPPPQYTYEPSSISSPTRDYDPTEVIPRSAPAARQKRLHTDDYSDKPLPTQKRSAVSFIRTNY